MSPRCIGRHFEPHFVAFCNESFKRFVVEIESRILLNRLHHCESFPRGFERKRSALICDVETAAHSFRRRRVEFFGDIHHLVVVYVRLIKFNRGEFGIVLGIHTFVAELATDFVHFLKSADNATFKVQLGCYTHVHIDVERIVVSNERTRVCAACKRVENGCFHFDEAFLVEHFADCGNDFAALDEHVFDFGICDKVNVTLAEAQFGVF